MAVEILEGRAGTGGLLGVEDATAEVPETRGAAGVRPVDTDVPAHATVVRVDAPADRRAPRLLTRPGHGQALTVLGRRITALALHTCAVEEEVAATPPRDAPTPGDAVGVGLPTVDAGRRTLLAGTPPTTHAVRVALAVHTTPVGLETVDAVPAGVAAQATATVPATPTPMATPSPPVATRLASADTEIVPTGAVAALLLLGPAVREVAGVVVAPRKTPATDAATLRRAPADGPSIAGMVRRDIAGRTGATLLAVLVVAPHS